MQSVTKSNNSLQPSGQVPTDEELQAQLEAKLLELDMQELEIVKSNRLAFYTPYKHQDSFHRSKACRRLLEGGNRSGKSTCGVVEDASFLVGHRPFYKEGNPARTSLIPQGRPSKGLVIATNWDKVDEIFTSKQGEGGKLWQYLPSGFVRNSPKNKNGVIDTIDCHNNSLLRFSTVQSFKHDPQSVESSDWDFIHVDEPCPEEMFIGASRGLIDRGGCAYFTLTPLSELWIHSMFFPHPGEHRELDVNQYFSLRASMRDNLSLNEEAISLFLAGLTDDEKQCRLNGIPLSLSGLVYKEFRPDTHMYQGTPHGWKSHNDPPKGYVIKVSIDPHPQTPHAILFTAVSPLGQKFIYDEVFRHCTIKELCLEEILPRLEGREVHEVLCDPTAWIEDPITGRTWADEFANHGVYVEKSSKALAHGILNMKEQFKRPNNIYVNSQLARFLFEISRYSYTKDNKPVDKDDHLMECMYRTFINEPFWYDPNHNEQPVEERDFSGRQLSNQDMLQYQSRGKLYHQPRGRNV